MKDDGGSNLTALAIAFMGFASGLIKQRMLKKEEAIMEKDLLDGKIGSVGSYDLEFKGGKLSFVLKANAPFGVNGVVGVELDSDAVIDAICKAIPGHIDDALGQVLKNALKA